MPIAMTVKILVNKPVSWKGITEKICDACSSLEFAKNAKRPANAEHVSTKIVGLVAKCFMFCLSHVLLWLETKNIFDTFATTARILQLAEKLK